MLSRSTRTIVNQVEAMKNLVNAFRDYAKLPAPELSPLDLNALVKEVASLYEASPISVVAELDRDLPLVMGDQGQLRQVIHNLLQNAEDAVAEVAGGEIRVITRREGTRAVLLVRDNGPGFAPEVISRAVEPYFTTRAAARAWAWRSSRRSSTSTAVTPVSAIATTAVRKSASGCARRPSRFEAERRCPRSLSLTMKSESASSCRRSCGMKATTLPSPRTRPPHGPRATPTTGPGPARHLDAGQRRHLAAQGVVGQRPAHHAGGHDVGPRHHRQRGRGHPHRRPRLPRETHRAAEASRHGAQRSGAQAHRRGRRPAHPDRLQPVDAAA